MNLCQRFSFSESNEKLKKLSKIFKISIAMTISLKNKKFCHCNWTVSTTQHFLDKTNYVNFCKNSGHFIPLHCKWSHPGHISLSHININITVCCKEQEKFHAPFALVLFRVFVEVIDWLSWVVNSVHGDQTCLCVNFTCSNKLNELCEMSEPFYFSIFCMKYIVQYT